MELLQDLNPAQLEAVTHGDGPLLIVAGVGTGKTTAITRRIAWLIAEKLARPAEILALTFTEKAAAEMEERVDLLVPYGYVEAQIGTFHAFCDRVLRENAILLGLAPTFRILTAAEQAIFLKERLFDLPLERFRPLGNPMRHLRSLLSLFSRAKDEDVTPAEYAAFAERLTADLVGKEDDEEYAVLVEEAAQQKELAETYATYQKLLAEAGFVDFGDQITMTLRLFREHPTVLERYRKRFRYILVDEFQDTNFAQWELLKLLASHRNLTVCGDDDQSIYKFRGAAISNILGFQETFPDAKLIVLDQNYRSTQAILDSAYRLIQNNNPDRLEVQAEITKQLHSNSEGGRAPQHHHFESLEEESDFVADIIAARHAEDGCPFSDFAILVRSNALADTFLRALNLARIPWRFSGSRGLYDQEEIRSAVALLRVLADPRDTLSLHYLASSEPYEVPAETLALATAYAQRQNKSLLQTFRILSKNSGFLDVTPDGMERIGRLMEDLNVMLPLSTKEKTGELLFQYLSTQTGTIERLSNSADPKDIQRVQNLARLFSIIERFSRVARYDRVAWFIDYLDDLIEAGDNPPVGDAQWETDAVSVLTIHQAKGLEFPIVFLVGLVSGRFPSNNRADPIPLPAGLVKDIVSDSDFHRQEERRLFYVGMTRAKEDVYFTSGQDYGGKRARKPSLFISEALDLDASQVTPERRSPLLRITRMGESKEMASTKQQELVLFPQGEEILTLSHRKIDDFLTCPKKYKYSHLLRVPSRPHHSLIYGNAIHQAIRIFHLNRIAEHDTPVSELHDVFKKAWQTEGFLSREHEELRLQQGLKALTAFHAAEMASSSIPQYVEKRFSLTMDDVRLVGIFDRIDIVDNEGTIIDYKTSDVQTSDQAVRRAKSSRQLALYALAYQQLFGDLPVALELRFLTPDVIIGRTTPTEKMLESARSDITTAAEGIRLGDFPGEPAYNACQYCAYATICPDRKS
ncbi:MAG: exodeoxyribonuclease V subunit gamma [Dehalococcoidia bacterium]|nr:exodeoxyribonuclease V subunit gamma [Dehalococcoidia bacterium]